MHGLPNERLKPIEIENFFQSVVDKKEMGSVMNVTLAYKFKDSLENVLKVSKHRLKVNQYMKKMTYGVTNSKKMQYQKKINIYKRKAVLENNLAKEKLGLGKDERIDYRTMQDKKVLKAFVSLEDSETALKLRQEINQVH